MTDTIIYDVEYTDLYGGESNYSWVKRDTVTVPRTASRATLMRRAKALMGISGRRGKTHDYGDMIEFRPYGNLTIMFITFKDTNP